MYQEMSDLKREQKSNWEGVWEMVGEEGRFFVWLKNNRFELLTFLKVVDWIQTLFEDF